MSDFKYAKAYKKGRPVHSAGDSFSIKHPPMPLSKRAKIFSPFDALKGFSEAVSSKEVQYVSRVELDADAEADLSRKLEILRNLTWNGRMARVNHVIVSVKYFVPCQDVNNFAFANAGLYETVTGMVLRVDTEVGKEITIQTETTKKVIGFDDILEITSESDVFHTDWEMEAP
jgi:hypothetical protein